MLNGELGHFRAYGTGEYTTTSLTEMPRPREFGRPLVTRAEETFFVRATQLNNGEALGQNGDVRI
jgi:hypothetical protein